MHISPAQYESIRGVLDAVGVRSPADAVRKLGLSEQTAKLRQYGVPEEVANNVVLVSYGKAFATMGTGLERVVDALSSWGKGGKRD